MTEFDILMIAIIAIAMVFGAIIVRMAQDVKMNRYSIANAEAAIRALQKEHEHQKASVEKVVDGMTTKLTNLGQ